VLSSYQFFSLSRFQGGSEGSSLLFISQAVDRASAVDRSLSYISLIVLFLFLSLPTTTYSKILFTLIVETFLMHDEPDLIVSTTRYPSRSRLIKTSIPFHSRNCGTSTNICGHYLEISTLRLAWIPVTLVGFLADWLWLALVSGPSHGAMDLL